MNDLISQEIAHLTSRLDLIIREQAGEKIFHHFDQIRQLAQNRRHFEGQASLRAMLKASARLNVTGAYQIAHAFSLFFQLTNLCEERARIRRLREVSEPTMSLRRLFRELAEAGVSNGTLQRCLDELEIQPVFTAHPTEAKRRAVLTQIWRIADEFAEPDEALEALWCTEEVREKRVGPLQEVANAVFYFDHTIFAAAANYYAAFDAELAAHFPKVKRRRHFLSFASWVGGDRDGNPFVTPEISKTVAQWHTCTVMDFYERQCALLVKEITHSSPQSSLSAQAQPAEETLNTFQPYEGLRIKLEQLRCKLRAGKAELSELIDTLVDVQTGLRKRKAYRAAHGRIQRLITQAGTFGLHLAELDFRDHSGKLDSGEAELLEEFRAIGEIQKAHGAQAAKRFILSMTRNANDLVRLQKLMERARVKEVDLVPLFETIQDLENAAHILRELWADAGYRAHLKRRGNIQEIMVGYSDSNKDGGYLAANWFLYRAQKEISGLADECSVKIRFFHGKGGSIDRGGGSSYRSLRAQPHAAHGGRIRITEQGEVISLKYSNAAIAQRNLEQLTSAVIAVQCLPLAEPVAAQLSQWESQMDQLARLSFDWYQQLVYGTPEFSEYFWQATPIDLIEHLRLGSRPTRRQATNDIRQLRAIPWVFAWTQSRHLLSAWYGVGHALEEFERHTPDGLAKLRDLYQHWPFFRALVENAEVSLAKTDLRIAAEYAAQVRSRVVRKMIFGLIEAEYDRSVKAILRVTQRSELLENQPVLALSIRRRNPFVDPLNYLQIQSLGRWRKAGEKQRSETQRRLLALTVNGIAFGMKSTG